MKNNDQIMQDFLSMASFDDPQIQQMEIDEYAHIVESRKKNVDAPMSN